MVTWSFYSINYVREVFSIRVCFDTIRLCGSWKTSLSLTSVLQKKGLEGGGGLIYLLARTWTQGGKEVGLHGGRCHKEVLQGERIGRG